jgi:hypothetical protein
VPPKRKEAARETATVDSSEDGEWQPQPKRASKPRTFIPSVQFAQSQHAHLPLSNEPIKVGSQIAFFMDLPENKGGTEWFVGTVSRISKGNWADIDFADGKLWCAVKESERGSRWVALSR